MVTPADIAKVIEIWTGVPVSQMLECERQNLRHLEDDLASVSSARTRRSAPSRAPFAARAPA